MNNASTHLLDIIRLIRARVGDGPDDDEFTRLLKQTELPHEAGFAFLSYGNRFAMLSVPQQNLANWYPETGWIRAEKETIASAIAEKYNLSLCEPPDSVYPPLDPPDPHHHLQLNDRRETIVIVHPQYLKVRLFGTTVPTIYAGTAHRPLLLGPDLLQDLSAFYQG
jgi:hypothetical protein